MRDLFKMLDTAVSTWESEGGLVVGDRETLLAHVCLVVTDEYEAIVTGVQATLVHHQDQQTAAAKRIQGASDRMMKASEEWFTALTNIAEGFAAHAERMADTLRSVAAAEASVAVKEYDTWKNRALDLPRG